MIVLARESRGWTQRELANPLEVSQATLSKYELGVLGFPKEKLPLLSELLRYEPEFFLQSVTPVGLSGDFLYRRRAHVSAKVRRRVQAEVNIRRMQLERLRRRADVLHDELPFPAIQPEEMNGRIDRIAQEVRKAWRIPHGPVQNLTAAIENAGGVVFTVDFETDLIDGTNVRKPGEPPMLFVNSEVPGDRHRFNLAHELGHTVMHFGLALNDPEQEANDFASEFLMPRAVIRSDLRNLDLSLAAQLKVVWGVSMAAIIRRAFDLRTISKSTYRRLFTAMNARGIRTREPLDIPFEKPEIFEELIRVHRTEYEMDDAQIRKVLFTDRLGPIEVWKVDKRPPALRLTGSLFDQN